MMQSSEVAKGLFGCGLIGHVSLCSSIQEGSRYQQFDIVFKCKRRIIVIEFSLYCWIICYKTHIGWLGISPEIEFQILVVS